VTLTVTVHNSVAASAPVRYEVTLHNSGSTPCGPPSRHVPPGRASLTLGPCGQLSTVISNASGVDVYPIGPYYCPLFVGLSLAAHGTLSATGGWAGYEYVTGPGGSRLFARAPAGNYRLLVDARVAVPFRLVGGTASPASPAGPAGP
jgi:hypothetical protein